MRTMLTALGSRRDSLKNEEGQKGFTLIELLVVVIIIGVLAAIAIPVYLGVQDNAKDSAVKADLTNLKTAAVAFQTSSPTQALPANVAALTGTVTINTGNYTSAGLPEITVTAATATAPASFCIDAIASNGHTFKITDATAPATGTC